jgi:twinkle protein
MLDRLSSEELWLVNHTKRGQRRYTCPWCSAHRKKKNDTCLSVSRTDDSIFYTCHHGDCNVSGVVRMRETHGSYASMTSIERRKREDFNDIDDRHLDWLSARGISAGTAHRYNLIGEEISGQAVVGFPYYDEKGNVVAVKKRFTNDKKFLCWQSPQSFFGLRQITKGDDVVIVEGEMDVLAMAEIGIKAVSVPNGASLKVSEGRIDPSEDSKFKFLWSAKEYLDAAKRIIIATDADAPGEALAEEIARRVGRERCWRVSFPEGAKDSNDVLLKHGAEGLRKAVSDQTPWPVQGLYDAQRFGDLVWELYDKGAGKGESTGYESVDELYTIVPGQVTIVTGIPSSGKSEFIDQVMVNLAISKGWKFGICSFENEPRFHIAKLMSKRSGIHFFDGYHRRMNKEEARAAFNFVDEHFSFVHQDDGSLADLDSILDRLRIAILRFGIRGAIIDPYNFISRDSRDKSETEWISDMLTKVKAFAMGHGIHIWFVAHPTKMQRGADGRIPAPGGFDISGSAAWFAKADCGLTVHREKDDPLVAQIHIWKCRFSWVGKQGQTHLLYNIGTTQYTEMSNEDQEGEEFKL